MMNQQQWPQLPLFLHTLEEKGFVLLSERYDLVLQIAQRSADLEELKLRLSALLSSTPQQQQQFTECFEQFFNPIIAPFNAFLKQQERLQEEWRHMQNILNHQIERTVQESPATKPKRSFYTFRNFLILLGLSLISLVFLNYAGFGLEAYIGLLALLVSFVLIAEGYRFFRKPERPYTLRREAIAPPSSFFDIHIPAYAEVRFGRAFQGIAWRLRQRLPTDQPVLDVTATIRKSIAQGGFFTPHYQYRSKAPAYLLLIDQSSVANHRFQLAELLHNWLLKQDIEVERFWYRNDPRTCWNEAQPSGVPLEQLPQRYAESQLLLFGDGWQLLNPASQKLQPWARAFAQWENRTLVTPIAPPAWTRKETQLAQLFILAPASVEGLRYWSESILPQTEQNSPKVPIWHEKAVLITKENFLTALHLHFPNERLREWLCALACFPVLNWELTLRIGAVLSQKYGTYLLDYANLRRLTRISWFYNGYIPEEMRELLYEQLDPTVAQLIHQCIVQILAEQVEDGRQHFNLSQRELALQIAVHQVAAGMAQAKDLIKYVWSNISSIGNQDFLVLKHFNSTPYDIKVPYDLVKLLQHNEEYYLKVLMELNREAYHSSIIPLYKKISAFLKPYFFTKKISIPQNENSEPVLESITKIKSHVASDNISAAVRILLDVTHNSDLQNEAILLSLRHNALVDNIEKGIIDYTDERHQRLQITKIILTLCKQLSKLNNLNASPPIPKIIPAINEDLKFKLENRQIIEKIRHYIAVNNISAALKILIDVTHDLGQHQEEAIMLSGRYHNSTRSYTIGTLDNADFEVIKIQVTLSILELCDKIQFSAPPFQPKSTGKKVFISYCQNDLSYMQELGKHLSRLQNEGKLGVVLSQEIVPNKLWSQEILSDFQPGDILLLLVSADFLAIESVWQQGFEPILELHEHNTLRVIPISIRPCAWDDTPFAKIKGLPPTAKPVSSYPNRDVAWLEVVKGIETLL